MNKILTITIPVYNMERYLDRCLSSLFLPECENNIEILIINDGSLDASQDIIDLYTLQYPKLFRAIHKENEGWGSCIKLAIGEAKGKYFKVLDSDDWFNSAAFREFIDVLEKKDADIIGTGMTEVYADKTYLCKNYPDEICNRYWTLEEYLRKKNNLQHDFPLSRLTYKTNILKENKFTIGDKYYSDIDFNLQPLVFVKKIYISSLNLYYYDRGIEGQSTSKKGYINHFDDYKEMTCRCVRFFSKYRKCLNETLRDFFESYIISHCVFVYKFYLKQGGDELNILEFDDFIKLSDLNIYNKLNGKKIISIIPFIFIWRKTGINVYKLLKLWI